MQKRTVVQYRRRTSSLLEKAFGSSRKDDSRYRCNGKRKSLWMNACWMMNLLFYKKSPTDFPEPRWWCTEYGAVQKAETGKGDTTMISDSEMREIEKEFLSSSRSKPTPDLICNKRLWKRKPFFPTFGVDEKMHVCRERQENWRGRNKDVPAFWVARSAVARKNSETGWEKYVAPDLLQSKESPRGMQIDFWFTTRWLERRKPEELTENEMCESRGWSCVFCTDGERGRLRAKV